MTHDESEPTWTVQAGTPRHHGIGKLMLAAHSLVCGKPNPETPHNTTDDIRLRLIDCMADFQLAYSSLTGSLPAELEQEMADICNELEEWRPKMHGHPATSGLFNGGRGKNGRQIAHSLAERILAVYVDVNRFDAVATSCQST